MLLTKTEAGVNRAVVYWDCVLTTTWDSSRKKKENTPIWWMCETRCYSASLIFRGQRANTSNKLTQILIAVGATLLEILLTLLASVSNKYLKGTFIFGSSLQTDSILRTPRTFMSTATLEIRRKRRRKRCIFHGDKHDIFTFEADDVCKEYVWNFHTCYGELPVTIDSLHRTFNFHQRADHGVNRRSTKRYIP